MYLIKGELQYYKTNELQEKNLNQQITINGESYIIDKHFWNGSDFYGNNKQQKIIIKSPVESKVLIIRQKDFLHQLKKYP